MTDKKYSLGGYLWQYARIIIILFVCFILLFGAFSFSLRKEQMEKELEANLSDCTRYLDGLLSSAAYAAYTLATDPSVMNVMNSPLTANPYEYVKVQERCNALQAQLSPQGLQSVYLYHGRSGTVFASGFGKTQLDSFPDRAFLEQLPDSTLPSLDERMLSEEPMLTLTVSLFASATYRNGSYLCFNLRKGEVEARLQKLLAEGYGLSLLIPGEEQAVYFSKPAVKGGGQAFFSEASLNTYRIQAILTYPKSVFYTRFLEEYVQSCGFFLLLIVLVSVVLLWGIWSLQKVFRPMIYKLAELYRQSDSREKVTIRDLKNSFDRLVKDQQLYSDQLRGLQWMVKERLLTDLLLGNITSEGDFIELCKDTGISCQYERYLTACIHVFNKGGSLSVEAKVFSRAIIRNLFTHQQPGRYAMWGVEENDESVGILLNYSLQEEDGIFAEILTRIKQAESILEDNPAIGFFLSAVYPVERITQIPQAYRRARSNQIYRYIMTNTQYITTNMTGPESAPLISQADMNRVISAANADRMDLVRSYVETLVEACDPRSTQDWYKLKTKVLVLTGVVFNQIFLSTEQTLWQQFYESAERLLQARNGEELLTHLRALTGALDRERISALVQSTSGSRYVQQAYQYIEHNYDRELSVNDIAESLSVNVKYLSRLFKQESGQTMSQYIAKLRMEKAVKLLENAGLSIQEVGERVGFADVRGFVRLFKKVYGQSPREYREGGVLK